ncbi:MAG TPA: hypothetical protein DDW36_00260 [Candidatus Magasanikbacteria bacterium]|nr:hypothetical protein [Candidatus Magasanikbacteria bacterium]
MKEQEHNAEMERLKQFAELHRSTHEIMDREVAERIRNNPNPTEEEIFVGAFREMIEPHVRDAVFECYRKGYATESSGFGGEFGEVQSLDGYFDVDKKTKGRIEALGAKVLKGKDVGMPGLGDHYTFIQFKPEKPKLDYIKAMWDAIVEVMPQKNVPAQPSISGGSEDFRREYASDRTDVEKIVLKRCLALDEYSPEAEQKMRERLEELSN